MTEQKSEYYHTISIADPSVFLDTEEALTRDYEKIFYYQDKKILVVGNSIKDKNGYKTFIIVPGFIINYKIRETEFGSKISDIEIITKNEQNKVRAFLRNKGLEDIINFWS